jgi:probable HAF family extracellular repeat protein
VHTQALAVNASGQVAGFYTDALGVTRGFLYDPSTNGYTVLSPPGSTFTVADGVANSGRVVGYYYKGTRYHGFTFTNGRYVATNPPGSTGYLTLIQGISSNGKHIAGEYQNASGDPTVGFAAAP